MSNIPKLRFPEFSGEWEEKTFGDILSLNMVPVEKPDTEYERLGILCHNKGTFHEHITDPSYIALDTLYKVHKHNFIVNITFAWEHAIAITTEKDEDALVTFRFLMFTFNNGYYYQFFKYAFSKEKFRYDLGVASPGGAGRNRVLNQKQLNKIPLIVPSKTEQQKIADFLSNVDSIITVETKILNTLQKKKKALMQKLFTQQLRFKSDDGKDFPAWGEKKVIDFAKVDTGANNTQDKVEDGPYPFYVRSPIIYRSNKYIFDFPEAVLTVGDGVGTGKVFHYVQGKFDCHQRVYVIHDFENVLGKYFYFYFSEKFYARVKPMSAKNSVDSVRREMIADMKIPIPCKAEQQKIADCLSSMDSLIQNQQKVVTTWQQRKKALLQQMFI